MGQLEWVVRSPFALEEVNGGVLIGVEVWAHCALFKIPLLFL